MTWVALVATAGVAHAADTGMLPNGAVLEWPRLFIRDANGELVEPPDSEVFRQRLNLASCVCSQSGDAQTDLYYELHLSATTGVSPAGQIWVGTGCEDDITRPMQCRQVGDIADLDALNVREDSFPVRLFDLINASPTQVDAPCRSANGGEAFVWVISDTNNDSDPDFFSPRPIDLDLFPDVTGFDTQPPPLPEKLRATGGEGSIRIEWETPVSNATDLYAFHALCIDPTGAPVGAADDALFSTTQTVCDIPQTFDLTPTVVTSDEGTEVAATPAPFASLDPAFICHTETDGTATSLTIDGLENNVEYTIALVAVDFYGNPVATFFNRTITPKPVTDFWEDLDARGDVEGGFCSTSSPAGLGGMFLVLGAAWLWRRRRRLAQGVIAGVVVLAAFAPRTASADDFTPYWDDPAKEESFIDYEIPKWHAGIKLGPYTPAIDDQFGKNERSQMGPYQAMFGNYWVDGKPTDSHVYQILPMLDVDRFIWSGSGQLGIGGSLGYMQKTAFAYVEGSSPDDPRRPRSTASENTFRLIPFALTATYRATQLDDLYGIPLVPYIRGGLSYYVWWVKGPSGDIAKVCRGDTMGADCDANKAYGGTLGFQGSLGLAIRAERIDRDAARSMVQSGIYHAGFYAELMYAKVDGFGSDTKLSVGDKTWFAGVNFEF